ncbi:hypothetical protein E4U21_003785 [Claviceps maximensis]|nr:hypothetical protein E4U21_003785 [Claviceps maximensis]
MMRTSASLLAFLAAVCTCHAADDAPIVTNNPIDVVYTASLPGEPFFSAPGLSGNIRGFISASAPPDGVGVRFTVRFENLPKTGGPFPYHLHLKKATDGNCTAAGGHLDSTNRGEKPPCDAGNLPSCQVGDLSGKYGRINSDPFSAEYVDKFLSLKEDDPAFFGNRSFVIHLANTTRITCADFVKGGGSLSGASSLPSPSPSPLTGGAGNNSSTSALSANTAIYPTASLSVPSTSSSATVPVGSVTPSSLASNQDADDRCPSEVEKEHGAMSACASGTLAGCSSSSPSHILNLKTRSSSGNHSVVLPTTMLAAAEKGSVWSLAWWPCVSALVVALL